MAARRKPVRKSTPLESRARQQSHTPPRPCKRCAASARRRSCRSSRFCCRFISKLRRGNNFFGERFETRIAAEWVEQRVNSDISYVRARAILITLFKPAQRLLFVAQTEINEGKAVGCNVTPF